LARAASTRAQTTAMADRVVMAVAGGGRKGRGGAAGSCSSVSIRRHGDGPVRLVEQRGLSDASDRVEHCTSDHARGSDHQSEPFRFPVLYWAYIRSEDFTPEPRRRQLRGGPAGSIGHSVIRSRSRRARTSHLRVRRDRLGNQHSVYVVHDVVAGPIDIAGHNWLPGAERVQDQEGTARLLVSRMACTRNRDPLRNSRPSSGFTRPRLRTLSEKCCFPSGRKRSPDAALSRALARVAQLR